MFVSEHTRTTKALVFVFVFVLVDEQAITLINKKDIGDGGHSVTSQRPYLFGLTPHLADSFGNGCAIPPLHQ